MAGRTIGYVALPVIPSLSNFGASLSAGISKPIASVSVDAGKSAGGGIISGIVNGAKTAVATAGKVLAVGFGTVAAAGATVAGLAFKGGFSRALNIQDAQKQLTGLGHSTEVVTQIMDNALASVKGTAYGLDQAAGLAATVVAAGVKPGAELERTLRLTADAATIAKVPLSEMGQIIGKVASGQKLTTEVVQQFSQRGVPLLQMVAAQYGVTADEASAMVSRGEVDFATFQNALESNIGGAALASGETARGAFANIGAALSRFGAMFATPLVAGAPVLFQSLAGAIDRAAVVAQPLGDAFANWVTPALAGAAAWIDKIDFQTLADGLAGVYKLVVGGEMTTGLTSAFGWTPDSGIVTFILGVRDGVRDIVGAFQSGDFSSVGGSFQTFGEAITPLAPLAIGIARGIGEMAGTVGDLIAAGLPLIAPILDIFTGALIWLGENSGFIAPIILTIVGAMLLYRGAQVLANAASLASLPLQAARTAALFASAAANNALADATLIAAGAEKQGMLARLPATAAVIAQKVAFVGSKVATLAQTAASKVAAGAQWALNAAMSANPIMIVVLAIAALIAGLVWFFTQTELGQAIWTEFTNFLGEAWNNIVQFITEAIDNIVSWVSENWGLLLSLIIGPLGLVIQWIVENWSTISQFFVDFYESVLKPIFDAIGAVFVWIYENIIQPIILGIVLYIGIWAAIFTWIWESVIQPVFGFIGEIFTWIWETIILPVVSFIIAAFTMLGDIVTWLWTVVILPAFTAIGDVISWLWNTVVSAVINYIVGYFQMLGAVANWLWLNAINPAIQAIGAVFNWLWNNVFSPVGKFISDAMRNVGKVISDVFGGISTFIGNAFQSVLGAVSGPINGIIGLINSVIGALNSVSVTVPDWPVLGDLAGKTYSLNIPKIPQLATGADIMARAGGTLAILGEGGQDETVTNLGSTNRQIDASRRLAEAALAGGVGGGTEVRVFIGTREITDIVTEVVDGHDDASGSKISRGKRPKFGGR